MKTLISLSLTILFALTLAVLSAFGASEFDLRKGIDLTGATNVTASQLNQLVDAGLISSTNKGGILRRSGNGGGYWPDVTLNPRYTNFVWLDLFFTPPVLKTYVPVGDGYTNWINAAAAAAIPNGSIGNAQLAANAVNTTNIATNAVTSGQINPGAILNYHLGAGAVSNLNIADNTILNGKLTAGVILSTNIAAGQLLPIHFGVGSVTSTAISNNAVGNPQLAGQAVHATNIISGTITSNQIANLTITSNQIANGTINSNQIAPGTLNYSSLDTNASYGIFKAYALIDSGGNLLRGFNITASGLTGTADYFFTLTVGASDTNRLIFCTPYSPVGSPAFARVTTNLNNGRVAVRVTDATVTPMAATVAIGVLSY